MLRVKSIIKQSSFLGPIARRLLRLKSRLTFRGANVYWEQRYANGGNSGAGSYGHLATFKADVLNRFVHDHDVKSVIELGCGDGNQLSLAEYPSYIGLDVSPTAIRKCLDRFPYDRSKSFFAYIPGLFEDNHGLFTADLALSLDVLYHLTEDVDFEHYMCQLFKSAKRHVIIYSSDKEERTDAHVRHHKFTRWIEQHVPHWRLTRIQKNQYPAEAFADFYFFTLGVDM